MFIIFSKLTPKNLRLKIFAVGSIRTPYITSGENGCLLVSLEEATCGYIWKGVYDRFGMNYFLS